MKRIISLLLVLAMGLSLTACAGSNADISDTTKKRDRAEFRSE